MALSAKQAALEMIERMPEDVSFDDIMYAIYLRKKTERRLHDIEESSAVSHEDMIRDVLLSLSGREQENASYHLEREGHVTVLVPDRPLPEITTEMVNDLIEDMRREREDRWLGLSADED